MTSATTIASTQQSGPDYGAIKNKQQAVWGSGDYGRIGVTLQIVGEQLCEALDLRSGQTVLDVAAGNGNASLAAARRFSLMTVLTRAMSRRTWRARTVFSSWPLAA